MPLLAPVIRIIGNFPWKSVYHEGKTLPMHRSTWMLLGTSTFALAANPNSGAPDFHLAARPNQGLLEIRALAPEAHHFNLKAPMILELHSSVARRLAPRQAEERELVFQMPAHTRSPFQVSLYVCNNENTYCEKKSLGGVWNPESRRLMVRAD
jgi:hypothetical protein